MLVKDFTDRCKVFKSKTGRKLYAVQILRIWGNCIGVGVNVQTPFYITFNHFYKPVRGEHFDIVRPSQLFKTDWLYIYEDEVNGKLEDVLTAAPVKRHCDAAFKRLYF